ncbi:MAG: DNA repair protein RadC [Chloroflexi bacterium]|nr:MAG: DNA repair protein RadC [Chloroflexota bacterium]
MSQLFFTSESPLMVRDSESRRYRLATPEQILAAARRVIDDKNPRGTLFESPAVTREYLRTKLAGYDYEVFAIMLLDSRHRLIQYIELFRGTIDGASVHPREVVREVLRVNAAAVILAHNHPSGVPEPSQADELITLRLREALALIDVRTLDHIIVGGDRTTSLAERGLL